MRLEVRRAEHRRRPRSSTYAMLSDFNHFEVFLARTALRTGPVHRNIGPGRACRDAVFRYTNRFVIDPPTNQAHPSFRIHRSLKSLFIKCNECIYAYLTGRR